MRKVTFALFAASMLSTAMAGTIFDLSPTNGSTDRTTDGPGQGVSVSTTTTISDFGFFLNMPGGGDLKFMIWDGTNSNLLLSTVVNGVAASGTQDWVYSGPISFTLTAGQTYYFGVIPDAEASIGYIFPTVPYSANGLTALETGNSNYANFGSPGFEGSGLAEIGLRIDSATATPEPATLSLIGFALLAIGAGRKNFKRSL